MGTATRALNELRGLVEAGGAAGAAIDLSGLQRFDSAVLAMLLELRRPTRVAGDRASASGTGPGAVAAAARLRLIGAPDKLRALARLYGLDTLLFDGSGEHGH